MSALYDDMVKTIEKTIESLPAERRLYPDLYADDVARALLAVLAEAGVLTTGASS